VASAAQDSEIAPVVLAAALGEREHVVDGQVLAAPADLAERAVPA
jgi:hypothetical protein